MILRARLLLLSAAIIALLAGASYARGAPAAGSQVYISGIQVNANRPNIVYASTLGPDSVLKSTDAGKTWSVADTGLENMRVDALALDPRSPNVLYAGTGRGVFKTSDGARTWKLASTGIDFGKVVPENGFLEGAISAIAIDPLHTRTVYAVGGGVWKSTNGGITGRRSSDATLSTWRSTRVGPGPSTPRRGVKTQRHAARSTRRSTAAQAGVRPSRPASTSTSPNPWWSIVEGSSTRVRGRASSRARTRVVRGGRCCRSERDPGE